MSWFGRRQAHRTVGGAKDTTFTPCSGQILRLQFPLLTVPEGLCSKILGLCDLTHDGEMGLGQQVVEQQLLEPQVSGGEGGEGLLGICLVLPPHPSLFRHRSKWIPLMGP